MANLNASAEIFSKKREKAIYKLNSFKERFEKMKSYKTADLKEAGEIVKKMNDKCKWMQSIP